MLISFAILSFAATVLAMALLRGEAHLEERREDENARDDDVLLPVVPLM